MKTLSSTPDAVGVCSGEMDTNLDAHFKHMTPARRKRVLLVVDRTKKIKSRSNLELRFVCFYDGADNCNINILGADIVGGGHHRNVNIYLKVSRVRVRQ